MCKTADNRFSGNMKGEGNMKKRKVISLVLLAILVLVLLDPVLAHAQDPHKDALIRRVLISTVEKFIRQFGWGPWDDKKIMVIPGAPFVEGCYAGYSTCVYVPFSGLSAEMVAYKAKDMAYPVHISSFKTEQKAALFFSQEIKESGSKKEFHGYPAVRKSYEGGESLGWQAGRFIFEANIEKPTLEEKKYEIHYHYGTDIEGLAEELYKKAMNAGLLSGEIVEGVAFTIKVQAPGYLPWSDTLATKDYKPSSITLKGVVKDEDGNPVSGATISIPDLGKSVTSGAQGNYKLHVQTEGTKPFTKVHNIVLQKKVTGASIKVETKKVIPVPGEVPITITALDQDGKPFKGSVEDITIVDKNNKQIYFTELEKTTGYNLDDTGRYSTKLKIWNPGERELKWGGGYTYLRDIPLTATIRVKIQDKELNAIGKEEKTVPFNLALIHGVVVDNKDLKPVTQHYEPDVIGIPTNRVFKKEKNQEGDFWVMVKPNPPLRGKSIQDIMNTGKDFALKWGSEDNIPLVYSIEEAPVPGEVLELGKVGKTPLEKIKEWYTEFGTSPHTWPDGRRDKKALTGPYSTGALNNFMDLGGCTECSRFNCVAMQYKTLWFLNHLKNKKADDKNAKFLSKLKGWNYSAVIGVCPPIYPQHNAVALWDRGKWDDSQSATLPPIISGAIILDPHGNQKPHWYGADTVLFSWHIYTGMEKKHEGSGWKPPWPPWKVSLGSSPQPLIGIMDIGNYGQSFTVNCPVDVLIVNSQGHRLGILPNGDKVAEFEPIDSYFWQDEKGDKQWFFALPQDTYKIDLLGTGSGNFHLLTSPSGGEIYDYGENRIDAGEKAALNMKGDGDELTLADGKEVTPTIMKLPLKPNDKVPETGDSIGIRVENVADAYVYAYSYRNWNKANWGKYENLGAGWNPKGGEKRTFLEFDFSGVDPKNVGKATLKLFHSHTGGNNSLSLGVHAVTRPWQEGGGTYHSGQTEKSAAPGEISWVNQPTFNFSPVANFNPGSGTGKYIEVDITPLVMAWLTGKPNYGLMIKPVGIMSGRAPESSYGFYSRERKDESKRPVLVLSGSSGSNTQTGNQPPPQPEVKSTAIKNLPRPNPEPQLKPKPKPQPKPLSEDGYQSIGRGGTLDSGQQGDSSERQRKIPKGHSTKYGF